MNINIYEEYKVKITKEGTELSEENETIYDNIFEDYHSEATITINGGKLLHKIADNLKENYFSEFVIVGNELNFEYFNYNNGESEHICYEILEDLESIDSSIIFKYISEIETENNKLNNIIDELEKFLIKRIEEWQDVEDFSDDVFVYKDILSKLKELKGDDKNENN